VQDREIAPPPAICEAVFVLFALDVSLIAGWAVVAVTGELELGTAPRLRQQVVSLVGDGKARIVLDLSGVEFVDSIGLGVIVSALKRVRAHGGDLVVAGTIPRVQSLFTLTRLDQIIDMYPSVPAALAAAGTRSEVSDG
jgi:anti-sigma B factor antagonist